MRCIAGHQLPIENIQVIQFRTSCKRSVVDLVLFDPNLVPGCLDMSRILFPDFDGVMHPESDRRDMDFCYIHEFQDAVREADPNGLLPIVISSMWRETSTLAALRSHFDNDIARQIVGVTPELAEDQQTGWVMQGGTSVRVGIRQREIEQWMGTFAPTGDWLAVDDRSSYFADNCPNLFLVPGFAPNEGAGLNSMVVVDFKARLMEFLK